MCRTFVLYGLVVIVVLLTGSSSAVAVGKELRSGEIGVEVDGRRANSDIVPETDNGLGSLWGIEGAWAFNRKWALFWDINTSRHDSEAFCAETPSCSALTPDSLHKVVAFGMERRLNPGPKGGQWAFGLGTGMMDVDSNGVQVHHRVVSINAGRRRPRGPEMLHWPFRIETGLTSRTDAQLDGALDSARLTNVVFAAGWGLGFGKELAASVPASSDANPSSTEVKSVAGR